MNNIGLETSLSILIHSGMNCLRSRNVSDHSRTLCSGWESEVSDRCVARNEGTLGGSIQCRSRGDHDYRNTDSLEMGQDWPGLLL